MKEQKSHDMPRVCESVCVSVCVYMFVSVLAERQRCGQRHKKVATTPLLPLPFSQWTCLSFYLSICSATPGAGISHRVCFGGECVCVCALSAECQPHRTHHLSFIYNEVSGLAVPLVVHTHSLLLACCLCRL